MKTTDPPGNLHPYRLLVQNSLEIAELNEEFSLAESQPQLAFWYVLLQAYFLHICPAVVTLVMNVDAGGRKPWLPVWGQFTSQLCDLGQINLSVKW